MYRLCWSPQIYSAYARDPRVQDIRPALVGFAIGAATYAAVLAAVLVTA